MLSLHEAVVGHLVLRLNACDGCGHDIPEADVEAYRDECNFGADEARRATALPAVCMACAERAEASGGDTRDA